MSGEATPALPAAPATHVKVDPLNPSVVIPVYLGGEGPVPTPPAGDRGDAVVAPVAVVAPAVVASPLPQGTVATAVAADAVVAPAAASPVPAVGATPDVVDGGTPADTGGKPAEAVAPAEPAPVRNEKGQFIPRARFNEVNEERKRLAEENATLKAEKAAPAAATAGTYDFDAKEKEYANFVLDGKVDEAIALRKEIRAAERADFVKDAEQTTVKTTARMTEQQQINKIVDTYSTGIPQFDPESEHYNDDLLSDVRDMYSGAIDSGRYPDAPAAFQAAIDKALKLHGLALPTAAAPAAAVPATPAVPAVPARTAAKRVEAIVGQPPTLAAVGTTGAPEVASTIDVKTLSEKDLRALPFATLSRLRGDIL